MEMNDKTVELKMNLPQVVLDWLIFYASGLDYPALNEFMEHIVLEYLESMINAEADRVGLKTIIDSGLLERGHFVKPA